MALVPPEQEEGGRSWAGTGEGGVLFSLPLGLLRCVGGVGGQGGGHAASMPVGEWA